MAVFFWRFFLRKTGLWPFGLSQPKTRPVQFGAPHAMCPRQAGAVHRCRHFAQGAAFLVLAPRACGAPLARPWGQPFVGASHG